MTSLNLEYSQSWHGKLDLIYQYRHNKTQLSSTFHQAPFKVQRSFYPENYPVCHTIIIHTAGGIVGGDRLSQNITLEENCQTLITTPTANKVYKTKGETAIQNVILTIGKNSYLEYLPQENIIFNGAKYQQNFQVYLDDNAHYCTWEINRFGRTARGETFISGDWKSSTEVYHNNQLIWCDRQLLMGDEKIVNSLNVLAGYPISGTFCWLGQEVDDKIIGEIRRLGENEIKKGEMGVTQLLKGLLCRYRGKSTTEVKQWFIKIWSFLRLNYHHRLTIIPRVWQM